MRQGKLLKAFERPNLFFLVPRFFIKPIRTMPAPALATVATLAMIPLGEDHQSFFEIEIFAFF